MKLFNSQVDLYSFRAIIILGVRRSQSLTLLCKAEADLPLTKIKGEKI